MVEAAEGFDREVRARGLEVKRRDTHRRVHNAFATALFQEQAHEAQAEIQLSAEQAVATTQARVDAGDGCAKRAPKSPRPKLVRA